jgi:hypothetical protein
MTTTLILLALVGCGPAPTADAGATTPVRTMPAAQDAGDQKQDPPKQDPPAAQHRTIEQRSFQLDSLQTVKVKFGEHVFRTWVMDTHAKRQEGMMFLQDGDFEKDEAMIFVFQQPQPLSFWMKNTLVPLDIAYCDPQGRVLNTYTMRALDTMSDYGSAGPAMFAIEFKAGTFKRIGVQPGKRFEIPEDVVAKD